LLVTHHVGMAQPIADYIVSLENGQVKAQGSVTEALRADPKLFREAKADEGKEEMAGEIEAVEGPVDAKPSSDGKLILAEEKAEGHLSLSALKLLCDSLGGPIFWVTILIAFAADQGAILVQTWCVALGGPPVPLV
jgi:ABC-type glutathione transport system ATPase component